MKRAGAFCVLTAWVLAGCGGGGGDSGGGPTINNGRVGGVSYAAGVYPPSSSLAGRCESAAAQNNFLRSWTHELYLWYREVPDLNPSSYGDPLDFFDLLKTSATTTSGQPKDKFHFTYDTDEWIALSQSGVSAGYGVDWLVIASSPPRRIVAPYVEPGYAAAAAGLARGTEVLAVDGVDVINSNTQAQIDAFVAGLYPNANETHTFLVRDRNGAQRTVTMTSANVTATPVPTAASIDDPYGRIGYLLFNDHIATAETQLVSAITRLRNDQVTDLVLDLRYNGGGYLDIASELAYMIGGVNTSGRVFERLMFNDQHPSTNPITGRPLTPTPFHTTTQGFSGPSGVALPTLNLGRVYVLTGPNTCSASESIINSLRGVGVDVYQIGATTCGKPYGFYPQDNCGTTYFSIQFQGNNDAGFGAYSDGFSPQNTGGLVGEQLPGCSVADDFTRELGDPNEGRFAAAIAFRAGNHSTAACPAATGFAPNAQLKAGQTLSAADGEMHKSPLRENRLLRGQ